MLVSSVSPNTCSPGAPQIDFWTINLFEHRPHALHALFRSWPNVNFAKTRSTCNEMIEAQTEADDIFLATNPIRPTIAAHVGYPLNAGTLGMCNTATAEMFKDLTGDRQQDTYAECQTFPESGSLENRSQYQLSNHTNICFPTMDRQRGISVAELMEENEHQNTDISSYQHMALSSFTRLIVPQHNREPSPGKHSVALLSISCLTFYLSEMRRLIPVGQIFNTAPSFPPSQRVADDTTVK